MMRKKAAKGFDYNVFVSYSHAADRTLAPAVQSALYRIAKPWYKLQAMRVFRDDTGLGLTPELWPSIEQKLRMNDRNTCTSFQVNDSGVRKLTPQVCWAYESWPEKHFGAPLERW